MRLHIRNARIVDPAAGTERSGDLYIAEGRIAQEFARAERVIDASGLVAAPGFVDLAARLREPGYEYKATLESELEAALAGGVTTLACPPDTDPPLDEPGLVDMLRRRAAAPARTHVYPVGALTVGLRGEALTEMGQLTDAGCIAFSQGNAPLPDTQVLWRTLQYAATFGYKVWLRAEDAALAKGGVAHDGEMATRLGLPGIPAFAESIALGTLIELARATGARLHICRLSTASAVELIRRAKAEKLQVSCDVSVHHLHLCDRDLGYFDSQCRLEPPLRSARDRDALSRALAEGVIDCAVSDHTPVDEDGKHLPFAEAEPGATALELLLPLTLKWGEAHRLPLAATLARITTGPAGILGVDAGRIAVGAPADLTLFDPRAPFRVSALELRSQGKNTPFLGHELTGRVRYTVVAGNVAYEG
jgi:dihydroorotase